MDKLQPLITHKFWVLLGLTVLLAFGAYWMGTGTLAARTDADWAKVTGIDVPIGEGEPNRSWVEKAEELAAERQARLDAAARMLADTQQDLRVWPAGYQQYVEGLGYFEPLEKKWPPLEAVRAREAYGAYYPGEIEGLRELIRPYDHETQTGVTAMPLGTIPAFDTAPWQQVPPLSMTIWSAQEDVWLLRELLKQTVKMNASADSLLDAPLKEIQSLTLRGGGAGAGGAGEDGMAAGGTAGDVDGAPMSGGMMEGSGMDGGMMSGPMGGSAAPGGADVPDLTFDLDEEVGPAAGADDDPALVPGGGAAAEEGAAPASTSGSSDGYMPSGPGMMGSPGMMGDSGGLGGRSEPEYVTPGGGRRYVTSDPLVPYRTRAFQMQVAVDHRRLGELLADVSNCAWPVEILRVHYAEGVDPAGPGQAGGARGRAGGGFGGFGGGGFGGRGGGLGGFGGGGLGGSPSGGMLGSPMGPGRGSRGAGGGGRARPQLDPSDPYQVALADPYLATVVIGGVMTIYKPLPEPTPEELAVTDPDIAAATAAAAPGADATAAPAVGADPAAPPAETPGTPGADAVTGAASDAPPAADGPPADRPPADAPPADGADAGADLNFGIDLGIDLGGDVGGSLPPTDPAPPAADPADADPAGAEPVVSGDG